VLDVEEGINLDTLALGDGSVISGDEQAIIVSTQSRNEPKKIAFDFILNLQLKLF